jgi:diguanylate cyclase
MLSRFYGVSPRAWRRVLMWTVLGPLICAAICVVFVWFNFRDLPPGDLRRVIITAFILPLIIAAPLFFLHSLKLRELAIANHKLNDLASLDSLTGCLNRRTFQARVEKWLHRSAEGAFLIMDADYFKAINDTYGHERGDEALRVIASAIRSAVRPVDICGRIGGEEFGVYLPNATVSIAVELAERLRAAVSAATFVPYHGAENLRLTMSVGCAVHSRATTYAELFAVADDELYVAKEQGRDRVRVATLEEGLEARAMPRLRQANQNRPPR